MRREKDLRRALRARTLRIVTAERAERPICCLVWSMGADPEGRLLIHFTCLVHDASWETPVETTNPGFERAATHRSGFSPCPTGRPRRKAPPAPAENSATGPAVETTVVPSREDEVAATLPLFSDTHSRGDT